MTPTRRTVISSAAGLAAAALIPWRSVSSSSGSVSVIAPASGTLVGAYIGTRTLGGSVDPADVPAFETLIGRPLAVHCRFAVWDYTANATLSSDGAAGRIPLIAWSLAGTGHTYADVNNGSLDAHLASVGHELGRLGPILFRWTHEMNVHQTELGTSTAFKSAWKRARSIIKPLAPQAEWGQCWTVGIWNADPVKAASWYVGATQTEWLMIDGYNEYGANQNPSTGLKWRTPSVLFDAFHKWAAAQGKPLCISEVGSTYDPAQPDRQAAWVTQLAAWVEAHPLVKCWSYAHTYAPIGDFRLDQGTGQALTAYRSAVTTPYMNGVIA